MSGRRSGRSGRSASSRSPRSSPPAFSSSPAHQPFSSEDDPQHADRDPVTDGDSVDPDLDEEEEEGEELIAEGMEEDYRPIPHLDVYDPAELADENEQIEEISEDARRAAEREMRKRDKAKARGRSEGRVPRVLGMADSDDVVDDEGGDPNVRRRRLMEPAVSSGFSDQDDDNIPIIENLEDLKGNTLREWVCMESTSKEIHRRFRSFLTTYLDDQGNNIHAARIKSMCESNGESLVISYSNLCREHPVLAIFVADAPKEVLKIFDSAAKDVVLSSFPEYDKIRPEVHVRISELPVSDKLRDIRQVHLNALIKVTGVVIRRTAVYPQLKLVKYDCVKCSTIIGPILVDWTGETRPKLCAGCQSKGPFLLNTEHTIYRNFQRITIQESPGTVPAGRLPRQKEVILVADLIDSCKPGDEIELTGVYTHNFESSLNTKNGFPVFATVIEANFIERRADKFSSMGLSDDDIRECRELAKDEQIGDRIVQSIAPSIYGHEDIKMAIALAMFGGLRKNPGDKHPLRGDINVLLLGDPGTAKSQLLKYVEKTAHRAVFSTGQGASAVGLTASVSRDPLTNEWILQGGALVLADQGVCLIDEFDKMNDQDRTSIHEAMEQQTISISKAGIVTTLQARCSVIAAANPIRGRYNPALTFANNVDLTEPILSRFDVLCVIRDVVDPDEDERLASFVAESHMRHHPLVHSAAQKRDDVPFKGLPQDLLRKYIMYAKKNVFPSLRDVDSAKIAQLYSDLRRESQATGSAPVTVRHNESLIRLSEAHARMHLRESVADEDVNMACRVLIGSFVSTQKFSVMRNMQRVFSKYILHKKDNNELLAYTLSQLIRETLQYEQSRLNVDLPDKIEIDVEEFQQRARQIGIRDLKVFFESSHFAAHNCSLQERGNPPHVRRIIVKTYT
eukprot:m.775740 g.775740  ORF g.775740 m.775740 type:complete len:908 (+) comp59111_c2_seq2:88-2811(+)